MSLGTIVFILEGNKTTLECSTNEKIFNACERFASKLKENISKFNFKYNGNIINTEL